MKTLRKYKYDNDNNNDDNNNSCERAIAWREKAAINRVGGSLQSTPVQAEHYRVRILQHNYYNILKYNIRQYNKTYYDVTCGGAYRSAAYAPALQDARRSSTCAVLAAVSWLARGLLSLRLPIAYFGDAKHRIASATIRLWLRFKGIL